MVPGDTVEARRKLAKEKIKEITSWLKAGAYTYDVKEVPPVATTEADISIIAIAIQKFLLQIKATRKDNTYDTYTVQLKRFLEFLQTKSSIFQITQVTESIAHQFFDWMIAKPLGNKSISTTIGTMNTFFEFAKKRKIITVNPFSDVEKLPLPTGTRIAFADKDVRIIKEYLTVTNPDPQFWLYISFLYYGFFRPDGEARKLKIGDIEQNFIKVRSEDAKNNKTQFVQIAKGLEQQINLHELRELDKSLFIFSLQNRPGSQCPGEKWFYKKHQKMLETLGLNGKNYSQYSWKDTGVIALYRATKDVKLIQRMCRHSSLDQTDKYLKSLGLFLQDEILDSFPSI